MKPRVKNKTRMPICSSTNSTITFGKHKDKTIEWVLLTDPQYIIWLSKNNIIHFSQEILDRAYSALAEYEWLDGYIWYMEEPF